MLSYGMRKSFKDTSEEKVGGADHIKEIELCGLVRRAGDIEVDARVWFAHDGKSILPILLTEADLIDIYQHQTGAFSKKERKNLLSGIKALQERRGTFARQDEDIPVCDNSLNKKGHYRHLSKASPRRYQPAKDYKKVTPLQVMHAPSEPHISTPVVAV